MHLRTRVVWITGASSGIGEQLALQAASAGAKLILSGRRRDALERVRSACSDPARVAVLPFDLADFDASAVHLQAIAAFGPIDILVNNGGIGQRSLLVDTEFATFRQVLEVDFLAAVALTCAVVPAMQARGGGQIVAISSITGKVGVPLRTAYCAAKHALQGFMDAARSELARDGVQFTTVCPGYVRTEFSRNALSGDGSRHGQMDPGQANGLPADLCARRIWQAVAHGRSEVLIGREAWVVRLQRLAPGLLRSALARVPLRWFQNSTSNSSI